MNKRLILYYQPQCHLCDEAEALLHLAGLADGYEKVNIEDDRDLLMRYEIHVPVLKDGHSGQELFWPFDQAGLAAFLDTKT